MKKTLLLLTSLILALIYSTLSLAQSPQNLVIIGDSLTEGYGVSAEQSFPVKLEEKIRAHGKVWKVSNHGIGGSTTASAVSRVRWVLKNKPNLVILALGANDGLRGFKPEVSQKNLDEAIKLLKENKIKVLIAEMKVPPNYKGGSFAKNFEKIYSTLAKKHGIPLIPFILDGVAGNPDLNLKDGIHPNIKGHEVIADNIYKAIAEYL